MSRVFSSFTTEEIVEVVEMLLFRELDVRAVTLGMNIAAAAAQSSEELLERLKSLLDDGLRGFSAAVDKVAKRYGVRIVTKRLAVTPVSLLLEPVATKEGVERACSLGVELAKLLDRICEKHGVDYVGGYAAFAHKGVTPGDRAVIESIPQAIAETSRVSAMVNAASTETGINMDVVREMGLKVKETAELTAEAKGVGCARLVVMANAPEDNPFMPGAYHGLGEPSPVVNVAISGPGVIEAVVKELGEKADFRALHDTIKRTAFKITRLGELIGRAVAKELNAAFGIVDLSLAPSPKVGDSVADILEAMGVEYAGAPGSTAALALLVDAVKKGGAMATSSVGGLSGAFIPVSEDAGMVEAVAVGAMSLEKLEAMTAVCSTGIDMVAIPGDTSPETIAAIIADEMAIGVMLDKAVGVRIIPVPEAEPGDKVTFGGLLGETVVVKVSQFSSGKFIRRGGVIPPFTRRLEKG